MSPIPFFVSGGKMITPKRMNSVWDIWLDWAISHEPDRAVRGFLIEKRRRIWRLYGG